MLADAYLRSGKVRDLYRLNDGRVVLVASDRISAFDVVLPTLVPDKGRVLTAISRFWFAETAAMIPNHLLDTDPAILARTLTMEVRAAGHAPPDLGSLDPIRGRIMICRPAAVLPIEAVVRGYLSGSGWKEYRERGTVCGIGLPPGLRESDRLPEPIFTPATKAAVGLHDENISEAEAARLIGAGTIGTLKELSLEIYRRAAEYASRRGIIVCDTKFEFGTIDGRIALVDEVLTPDSSRFWPADQYSPGKAQPSYDKQFVRDYLEQIGFDKKPPGPALPADVVRATSAKYVEALTRITGRPLRDA